MKSFRLILIVLLVLASGCVYYNTFFLAKKNFNEAEDARKKSGQEVIRGSGANQYRTAIEKASKVLELHPDSKYVDDALFVIGKSFYHLGEFNKAETKFRELLATFPESEYAERSSFYLGKTRFQKEEYVSARESFELIDSTAEDRDIRAEATFMLGEIHYTQEDWDDAVRSFGNYLADFGGGNQAAVVQYKIANALYFMEDFATAKDEFLKVEKYEPIDTLWFNSRFRAGDCFYEIEKPDSGLEIFKDLASNEKFYDYLPKIYLKIAKGYEMQEQYEEAMATYDKLIEEFPRVPEAASAFYYLGRIHQDVFYDLGTAKAMYDSSAVTFPRAELARESVARSADIAKLDSYRKGKTAEAIEDAVESQFLLAELYLTQLDQPDSALKEYSALVDSFPESKFAPRALLALGWIHDKIRGDTARASDYYMRVVNDYSNTDYVVDAMKELGMDPDTADFDYPAKRYKEAERILFQTGDYERANEIFQSIVDDFPDSKYAPKAMWAKAWALQQYHEIAPPDSTDSANVVIDSTYILAFQKVAELYADTEYGQSAQNILTGSGSKPRQQQFIDDEPQDTQLADTEFDSLAYLDSVSKAIEEEIRELTELEERPTAVGEFIYPISAYNELWEGEITFKIKVDFTGRVTDAEILRPSGIDDIDIAAKEALLDETYFNPADIDPLDYGKWLVFRFQVRLPEELRDQRLRDQ